MPSEVRLPAVSLTHRSPSGHHFRFGYLTVSTRLPALRKWPKAPVRDEVTLATWTEEKPVLTREELP